MTLYLVSLGLWDEKDISLKGLETARKCTSLYLEGYTSVLLGTTIEKIKELIGKEITVLDRKSIEQSDSLIQEAKNAEIGLLVGGDATVATTHIDLLLQAKKNGVKTKVIHSSSVYTAAAESGLFIYKFGKAGSIPFPQESYKPESFYDIFIENKKIKAHTPFFLDLKPELGKYMTVNEALKMLLDVSKQKDNQITEETFVVGFARLGSEEQTIKADKIKNLLNFDFGGPMHFLVIPGELHFMEKEALNIL